MAERKKYNISPADIERRRQQAKDLHKKRDPVTGRPLFGGAQPGNGRPRKKRATEIINQKIEDHAEEIWDSLYNKMNSKKEMVSLAAIRQLIEIANKETDTQIKEEKSVENSSTEELIEIVSSRLARLAEAGKIPFDFTSTAEEVGVEQLDEGSFIEDEPEGSGPLSGTDAGS